MTISRAALEELDFRASDGLVVSLLWDHSSLELIVAAFDETRCDPGPIVGGCNCIPSTAELRAGVRLLESERRLALATPLARDPHYMADLDEDLDATRIAYTTAAVVDITLQRASSPNAPQG
jgi:hypothetical protein